MIEADDDDEIEPGLWSHLHAAFHRPTTRIYRVVDTSVWVLILVSVALLALEAIAGELHAFVRAVDHVILALFVLELGLRVVSFQPPVLRVFDKPPLGALRTHLLHRLAFLLSPAQLIDLITIVAVVPALRGLRVLRLLRLLRTARVFRYGNPFAGLFKAFEVDRLLFGFAFSVLGVETVLGGISVYLVEKDYPDHEIESVGQGIWWALVTLTTVGFGDYTPHSPLGRVVGGALMVGGMVTLALFAGIVGHSLLNAVLSIREEQFRMSGYVDHIIVCGYEPGGDLLLGALREEFDPEEHRVVLFSPRVRPPEVPPDFMWVTGDPTKESELGKIRLTHASSVIIVGSRETNPQHADANAILTIFTLRSYLSKQESVRSRHRPVHVVAEILDSENVAHARSAGADEVIESMRLGYSMLSHTVRYPGVGDLTSRVVASGAASFYVGRLLPGMSTPLRFGELSAQIRERTGAIVIGLRDPDSGVQKINPSDDTEVNGGTEVVYLSAAPVLPATRARGPS